MPQVETGPPSLEGGVPAARIESLQAEETQAYGTARPKSAAAGADGASHWLGGVPMHWMKDWPAPFPIVVAAARGAVITDIDGNRLDDFCLGDTGAMFGHSPPPVARAIRRQAGRGLTYMLPTEDALAVARLLARPVRPSPLADRDDRNRRQPFCAPGCPCRDRPAKNPRLQRLLSRHRRRNHGPAEGRPRGQQAGARRRVPGLGRRHADRRVQRRAGPGKGARGRRRRLRHHRAGPDQQLHGAARPGFHDAPAD